jgi:hypothetical protein
LLVRAESSQICADIHADMRGLGHEWLVMPETTDGRFEIQSEVNLRWRSGTEKRRPRLDVLVPPHSVCPISFRPAALKAQPASEA